MYSVCWCQRGWTLIFGWNKKTLNIINHVDLLWVFLPPELSHFRCLQDNQDKTRDHQTVLRPSNLIIHHLHWCHCSNSCHCHCHCRCYHHRQCQRHHHCHCHCNVSKFQQFPAYCSLFKPSLGLSSPLNYIASYSTPFHPISVDSS